MSFFVKIGYHLKKNSNTKYKVFPLVSTKKLS